MAIQFTDFSRAPLLDSPAKTIFEDALKGYQMSQEPAKMQQEASARELANQFRKLEVEHKPKEYELGDKQKSLANALQSKALEHYEEKFGLEKQLKQAQIQKALQTNLGGNVKANGELANYIVSHPEATHEEIRKAYDEIHGRKAEHENTIINRSKDVVAGNSFDKLPINDKKQAVALMKGMGVDPIQATSWLRSGKSPSQYAEENNIDISNVTPEYALGEQNIKEAQRASAYMDEIDTLDKHINEGLGQYQNKIMGYSLEQIADAAEGNNPDKQGRALAARALLPELSALRLKIAGGNIGIEALRELEHKSLGKLNIIEGLVDSPTFNSTQKYIRQWIEEAGRTRINSLNKFSMLKSRLQKGSETEPHRKSAPEIIDTVNGITTIRNGNKTLKIPEKLVDKYMEENMPVQFGGQYG
jgi:ribosomal protein L23